MINDKFLNDKPNDKFFFVTHCEQILQTIN